MANYVTKELDREIKKTQKEMSKKAGVELTYSQAQKILVNILKSKTVTVKQRRKCIKIE